MPCGPVLHESYFSNRQRSNDFTEPMSLNRWQTHLTVSRPNPVWYPVENPPRARSNFSGRDFARSLHYSTRLRGIIGLGGTPNAVSVSGVK